MVDASRGSTNMVSPSATWPLHIRESTHKDPTLLEKYLYRASEKGTNTPNEFQARPVHTINKYREVTTQLEIVIYPAS